MNLLYLGIGCGVVIAGVVFLARPRPIRVDKGSKSVDPNTLPVYKQSAKASIGTDKCDRVMDIPMAKKGLGAAKPITVIELFEKAASRFPDGAALKVEKMIEGGDYTWITTTWSEYIQQVRAAAKSFVKIGVKPYDSVGIIGFNRPEWLISDLGAIFCGAKAAGIYATNEPAACGFIAEHCQAKVVVAENGIQLEKFCKCIGKLTACLAFVVYTENINSDQLKAAKALRPTYSWTEFMMLGTGVSDAELEARMYAQKPGNVNTLIYTSGTTGPPKSVMITHDSVVFMASQIGAVLDDFCNQEEHAVSYLPLSHVAAQIIDVYLPMYGTAEMSSPATLWFARPDALKGSLPKTLAFVRPTFFFGVPRVWEKITEKIQSIDSKSTGIKKYISTWAKSVGIQMFRNGQANGCGQTPWFYPFANVLVLNLIRKKLGLDRCRLAATGAAPISIETLEYMASLGITVCELYGMSEISGASNICTPYKRMVGSVGQTMPGVEVILDHVEGRDKAGEGEILVRGRLVMAGYMNDAVKTSEAIDGKGFLHSGDIGRFDEFGFLYICGRIKELIITAGGENVAPVPMEHALLSACSALSHAVMIGDKRKYNCVLVTLKSALDAKGNPSSKLHGDALSVNPKVSTVEEAINDPVWKQYIDKGIAAANLITESNASKIQKFAILPQDLSISGGEITPSMKICRPKVMEKYSALIDKLYA